MGRALAAVLALMVLTGCVQVARPPAHGLTAEQSMAVANARADQVWSTSPYGESTPRDFDVTIVSAGEWPYATVRCMADAGFYDYSVVGSEGVSFEGTEMHEGEMYAQLRCFAGIQADPNELGGLNPDEFGYLYDYYRQTTVPCLQMAGVEISEPPTRAEFIESQGNWAPNPTLEGNPVSGFEAGQSAWNRSTPGGDLLARCPVWPPEWQLEG